jgi:hypothetical protein
MSTKDGGPAFPVNQGLEMNLSGMSLRDYFAAQFLTTVKIPNGPVTPNLIAQNCYLMADAMLEERAK